MPRPPVRRRNSNKQKGRGRSNSHSRRAPADAGLTSTPRVKLQEKLANKIVGQRPQDSDDSDRLVTRTRHGRSSRNIEQIFASGGVAKGDKPGIFPTSQERSARLRSDTEEIIRRSRSKSIEAAKERMSKSRSNSVGVNGARLNGASSPPAILDSQPQQSKDAPPAPQPTPGRETSVLGTLKPRRRQPSILQLIDNNDSSIINPEDEEQFLPDDESTPINTRKGKHKPITGRTSIGSAASSSKKRKFGMDQPLPPSRDTILVASTPASETAATTPAPEDSMSNAPRSPPRRLVSVHDDDDEIMAPPQSSSPEPSPKKTEPLPPTKYQRKPSVPTTEQLQNLMPSKRRKGIRQRNHLTEFDIPEDSDSIDHNEAPDESAFLPTKRPNKGRNAKARTNGNAVKKSGKSTPATPAGKHTSKSTSIPLNMTAPRTPLPLTRNANQENKTLSLARNRNSKANGDANSTAPAASKIKQAAPNGNTKPSGGSRPPRIGLDSDKENSVRGVTNNTGQRTTRSSARVSGKHSELPKAVNGVQPSIEPVADEDTTDDMEVDRGNDHIGTARTEESVQVIDETPTEEIERGAVSADVKAWKSRWGDIDQWDLDYEEVSISAGSDSPLRVSVV